MKPIITNKKAYFSYEILKTYEAGIVLEGSEVKAIRDRKISIRESFVKIIKQEAYLFSAHITHLSNVYSAYKPNETRERKLLLHKKEIFAILEECTTQGITIVPLKVYINSRNLIKLQIATVRGKKLYDKRESIKRREQNIEAKRAIKNSFYD